MPVEYSISLNGVLSAERDLNQAALRIESADVPSADSCEDCVTISDLAAEILAANRAETAAEANLRVISMQQELDRQSLNLFALIGKSGLGRCGQPSKAKRYSTIPFRSRNEPAILNWLIIPERARG